MELGALFVVVVLMIMMLVLCVLIWDILNMVSLSLPSTGSQYNTRIMQCKDISRHTKIELVSILLASKQLDFKNHIFVC